MNVDLQSRVDATLRQLEQTVSEGGIRITGDQRVDEDSAAALLKLSNARLRALRTAGQGPRFYRVRGGGRITYRLRDLSQWIESGVCDDSEFA